MLFRSVAKGAVKAGLDPVSAAKKGAGAVVGAGMAVKKAFSENETIGLVGAGINKLRARSQMNKGIKSEKSANLNATGAKGSFEHSGGFGNRSKLENVAEKKRSLDTGDITSSSSRRLTLDSMSGGGAPSLPKQMPGVKGRSRDI